MEKKVDIIIPNWNGEHLLTKCLESLSSLDYKNFKVVVVDNNSHDNSVTLIKETFPNIRVIELSTNTGFAHAVNEGIKSTDSELVALLNNDTEVDKYWLKELVNSLNSNEAIGIVTSKLINYYDRTKIDAAGDETNIVGQARSRGYGDYTSLFNKEEFVFLATGGASLYKREIFSQIGLFEETYYMYFEDADLSYRAQKNGIKVFYQPKAIVYHMHRASSNKRKDMLDYWLYRNFSVFYLINTPIQLMFKRASLAKFFLVFVHTAYYLVKQGKVKQVVNTWIWLILNIRLVIKLRRQRSKINVSYEYLDEWRVNKNLKILGKII